MLDTLDFKFWAWGLPSIFRENTDFAFFLLINGTVLVTVLLVKLVLNTNSLVASGCHDLLVVIYLYIIFFHQVGHHFQSSSDEEDDFKPISFLHTESSLQQVEIFSLKCGVIYSSLLIFRHPWGFELVSLKQCESTNVKCMRNFLRKHVHYRGNVCFYLIQFWICCAKIHKSNKMTNNVRILNNYCWSIFSIAIVRRVRNGDVRIKKSLLFP